MLVAIHIDDKGEFQKVAAWAAEQGAEREMLTKAVPTPLANATHYWNAGEQMLSAYKAMGAEAVNQSDVDKWYSAAVKAAEAAKAKADPAPATAPAADPAPSKTAK